VAALIRGPLAEALEAGRERFNALFLQARRAAPNLEPAAFSEFLREAVAPVVERVAAAEPGAVRDVVDELYDLSLEIVGRDLPARCPVLVQSWTELLGALPAHLARRPRLFAGSVTNALYNLETTPGARPREWAESMARLGAIEPDVPALLEAGKVAAWRAGMAHYRHGALAACDGLSGPLAPAALGLSGGESSPDLDSVLRRLSADPWLHPAEAARGIAERRLRLVARVGAFRGFGGSFLRPPRLTLADGHLFAYDGEACWVVHADLFGATLHRVGAEPPRGDSRPRGPFQLDRNGIVRCGGRAQSFPELREAASAVSDDTMLAASVPFSHAVYVVAVASPER
jgi:hypothetical protein